MNRATISRVLSVLLLLGSLSAAVGFNMSKPRVLVLHSYAPDYAWTRDIDEGIRRVTRHWSGYTLMWHYMDTKKHSSKDQLVRAGIVARRAIDQASPDVLIAVDDLAQELVASHYVNQPGIEIVFAGVNGSVEPYGYVGAKNVTGIYEHKQFTAVKEMLLALESHQPSPKAHPRLVYLLDRSESLERDRAYFQAFDWWPAIYLGSVQARDYQDWKALVADTAKRADYLLVANYRKLPTSESNPSSPPASEVMSWTETHSPIPVLGVNAFNVEDGGSLSVGVSPYEQGEVAARLAAQILERGQHAGEIPVQSNRQYVVAINDSAIKVRHLDVPTVYEAFARATANFVE